MEYLDKSIEVKAEFCDKANQDARCKLRERFLRAITFAVGKTCTFHMYSNTNIDGIFKGTDIEFDNILADNLKTPFKEMPHSILRGSDMLHITFPNISN